MVRIVLIYLYLIVLVLKHRTRLLTIGAAQINYGRLTATSPHRLVLAQVHPVRWSTDAATHELLLYIVPGHQVVGAGTCNGFLQRSLEHHLQVALVHTSRNAGRQLDDENDGQQESIL